MKRGVILLALFLLWLPLSLASELTKLDVSPSTIQLGDKFTISGELLQREEELNSGFVIVHLRGKNFIREYNADITYGKFSLTSSIYKKTNDETIEEGIYTIDVTVKDGYGNEEFFPKVGALTLNKKLKTTIDVTESTLTPGSTLALTGTVKKINGESAKGTAVFYLDNQKYTGVFTQGEFNFDIILAQTISSNAHTIRMEVEDDFGNMGEGSASFTIPPIETSLSIVLEKREFLPEEEVRIKVLLLDQASDPLYKEVKFKITQGKRTKVVDQTVKASDPIVLPLDVDAKPGEWTIEARSEDLVASSEFIVKSYSALDLNLKGYELLVTNVGNVKYTKNLVIRAQGPQEHAFERRTNLNPGESTTIKLASELNSGTYDIYVLDKTFEDVKFIEDRSLLKKTGDSLAGVTGNVIVASGSSTSKLPFFLFLVFVAIIIGIVVRNKLKQKKQYGAYRDTELKKAKTFKKRLQQDPDVAKQKLRRSFTSSKEEVESSRKRMIEDIKKEDERQKRMELERKKVHLFTAPRNRSYSVDTPALNTSSYPQEENKKENSLFSMFD